MSIEIYDTKGSVGEAATNTGFGDARRAVEQLNGYNELKGFFEEGHTTEPQEASTQALQAAHVVNNHEVATTLLRISKLLKKSKLVGIVQV